jgi:hypothetical protein
MRLVRTTIDLPEDLHHITMAIARDQGATFSQTVVTLLQRAIGTPGTAQVSASERTGLQVVRLGRTITSDDVRALDDEL